MFCNVVKLRKCIRVNPLTPPAKKRDKLRGRTATQQYKIQPPGKVVLFAAWMLLRFGGWEVAQRKKNCVSA